MTNVVRRSTIIPVARTVGCHGFPAVKERLWISFQHCAMLTCQRELENNTTNISSTLMRIYETSGNLEALLSLLILCKRHRGFFSCFLVSLPEAVVAFSVIKLLQYVIWIFIVINILLLHNNILSPKKRKHLQIPYSKVLKPYRETILETVIGLLWGCHYSGDTTLGENLPWL